MVGITGAYSTRNTRHAPNSVSTQGLLTEAVYGLLHETGTDVESVDGLAVSSFTLSPDRAVDLAWRMGLRLNWLAEDAHGGVGGANLLRTALNAVRAGEAERIVVVAGDHLPRQVFRAVAENYNSATRDHLSPLQHGGPNSLFAMVTQAYMTKHDLDTDEMALVALAQRRWAAENPNAAYRERLTLEQYQQAPVVFEPLRLYDCVPVVSGAEALLVSRTPEGIPSVRVLAQELLFNIDNQVGTGLLDGPEALELSNSLYNTAGIGPDDIDLAGTYDDYPVMALEQADVFGLVPDNDVRRFLHERLEQERWPLNTSGGQLSAGQAGCAAGLHFIVEAVHQLLGRAGGRQVEGARHALVSGYGMVAYRYGACLAGTILERRR